MEFSILDIERKIIEIGKVNGRKSFYVFVCRGWEKRKLDGILELGIKLENLFYN